MEAERLQARPEVVRICRDAAERLRGTSARVNGLHAEALEARGAAVVEDLTRLGAVAPRSDAIELSA